MNEDVKQLMIRYSIMKPSSTNTASLVITKSFYIKEVYEDICKCFDIPFVDNFDDLVKSLYSVFGKIIRCDDYTITLVNMNVQTNLFNPKFEDFRPEGTY